MAERVQRLGRHSQASRSAGTEGSASNEYGAALADCHTAGPAAVAATA